MTTRSTEILEDSDALSTMKTVSESPTTTMDKIQVLNKLLKCCELGEECCNFDLLGQLSRNQSSLIAKSNDSNTEVDSTFSSIETGASNCLVVLSEEQRN